MTAATTLQRHPRPSRRDPTTHLFTVGQAVRLKGGFRRAIQAAEIYRITGTLPARDDSPQYRIRNDDECHERVTTQDSLEPLPVSSAGDGATLIERTFGAETQKSRDQEAEMSSGDH
jgi:hypothetical protein